MFASPHVWGKRAYIASSTIQTYLSGICQIQIAAGFLGPLIDHMPQLHQVFKGIKVQVARIGRRPHSHLPITLSILCKLQRVWLEGNLTLTIQCCGWHLRQPSLALHIQRNYSTV